ncbi:SWIM zinc finger family protein [Microbulbifer sp. SSSA002]|uniref:SWIM zinc finger family protein n=1 Tax=unclassified Microbulbifer TaxID=2619833 RepID=UPI00403933F2
MNISLEVVQELAPDQASLNAAKKLLKPAKWPLRGKAASVNCIWGQCQGSGANPYYIMADTVDHGYKCTCPSRKFPCKHVLALLWQFADGPDDFAEGETPEWVVEWLGRRRKTKTEAQTDTKATTGKSLHGIPEEAPESAEEREKKEAAKAKRAAQTRAKTHKSIAVGLSEFRQWAEDQLRTGMVGFLKELRSRCRYISSRLVDAKAAGLASRIDELPAKTLGLAPQKQAEVVFKELGQLILLCNAWLTDEEDVDARRAIAVTENRDQILGNPASLRQTGIWQNIGEKVSTRRDGLVSHASWLLKLDSDTSVFALLLDHYPASAGRREVGIGVGACIEGELAFYPSRTPIRAFPVGFKIAQDDVNKIWPAQQESVLSRYQKQLSLLPWVEQIPHILEGGRLLRCTNGNYWWRCSTGQQTLPLNNEQIPALLLGSKLQAAFILWDGSSAELYSARTEEWGTIAC